MIAKNKCFESAVSILSHELKYSLNQLSDIIKSDTYEIRIRTDKPVLLYGKYGCLILLKSGGTSSAVNNEIYICSAETINEVFNRLCCYSVYSHIESIVNGYITYQGGHRAGIAGSAIVNSEGEVTSVKDISSINIRISKEIFGSSDIIMEKIYKKNIKSIIIAGPPSSGKTTVLRDLVRQLSDKLYKISLIDERQEIACVNSGICQNNVGISTDVYNCYPKGKGIMNALKTMSPEIIAVDEIGERGEAEAITAALNTGVNFITTVHALNYKDLFVREQIKEILSTGAFDYIVLLKNSLKPGEIEGIYDAGEIYDEIYRSRFAMDSLFDNGCENIINA